jgi:hypothetical protein
MTPRNRNILIAGGIIGLILLFMYRSRRKSQAMATRKPTTKPITTPQKAETKQLVGNANYSDAVEFLEALLNKGYMVRRVSDDVRKDFINEYQKDISKADHVKVMAILKKPEDKWTLEEEFFYKDTFLNNVLQLDNE